MEPEVKEDVMTNDVMQDVRTPSPDFITDRPGKLASFSTDMKTNEQWRQIVDKASELLSDLPEYLSGFFGEYRRPIVTVGLIVGAIITVKLTLAILDSVNDIPLLAPTFELIGLGYSAWFIYRYLLKASNRRELADDFNAVKEQVLGQKK